MKIACYTLGCKVNQYETEAIEELFQKEGYTLGSFEEPCDVYLINTCTVTAMSDKKSRQIIRRAKQQNPEAIVVVTGCYAQIHPKEAAALEGVDIVTGTSQRRRLPALVAQFQKDRTPQNQVEDIRSLHTFEPLSISAFPHHTRANIKVQDGCNNFCSYCIIPYARGPIRSKPLAEVVQEATTLAGRGFQEIVLTGIHLCSYGKGQGTDLCALLEALDQIPGQFRLRLGSLEPTFFTQEVVDRMAQLTKLCHHFHLSLQSGCDNTLQAMNRHYTTDQYRQAVERLRKALPDVMFTTDVITGFPGESEEDFETSMAFVLEMGFLHCHVFPYSRREGTRAAAFPGQLPNHVKSQRANILIAACQKKQEEILAGQVGKHFPVLFEMRPKGDVYEGYTPNYLPVHVSSPVSLSLQLHTVSITGWEDGALVGVLAD